MESIEQHQTCDNVVVKLKPKEEGLTIKANANKMI